MANYTLLESDSWFYTGLPKRQYDHALEKGVIEPIYLGQEFRVSPGLLVTKEEGYIDGHIEGYLTRVYGRGLFTKLWVRIPQGTTLFHDILEQGVPVTFVVTISIPVADSTHVDTWECGPELVEGVMHEYQMEEQFGPRIDQQFEQHDH